MDTYTSITEEDCKNVVLNSKYYNDRIEEKPYYKDSIISVATENILNTKLFYSIDKSSSYKWDYWAYKNVRFADALHNAVWKKIASEYEDGDTTDVETAFRILVNYIKVNAEED